jgi:hypothetical protein
LIDVHAPDESDNSDDHDGANPQGGARAHVTRLPKSS